MKKEFFEMKKKKNFLISLRQHSNSVEGLNSSLAQLSGELWCCIVLQKSGAYRT